MIGPKWQARPDEGLWRASGPAGRSWTGFPTQSAALTFAGTLAKLQATLTAAHQAAAR